MYNVVTFGSATQDVFMRSKKLKVVEDSEKFFTGKGLCATLGSKMHMDEVHFAMGGCGANAAVTFAKQGFKAAYLGLIGKDFAGDLVEKRLSESGVNLDLVLKHETLPTAFSVIISLPEVGRSILEKKGACHQLSWDDIEAQKPEADWFYIGSLSGDSRKIFGPLIDFAFENNIKVAINPGSVQLKEQLEETRALLGKIDILILNQEEAAKLAGLDYKEEDAVLLKLKELSKGIVIITKGSEGVIASDEGCVYSANIPKSEMVDRTGAGDAFASAFVSGWIERGEMVYAIQRGTANATSVVSKMGTTHGILEKDEWGPWEKVEVVTSNE